LENSAAAPWRPQVVEHDGVWQVCLGGHPIDLGGIGKGLAVRWAAAELIAAGRGFMVDAGGDIAVGGLSPDGGLWRVGVEDPAGGDEPLLVLEVTDTGCATSSTRLRRWRSGGDSVHHLVDPRTGRSGGDGLASVTVLHPDPARAEVWAKTLFLAGADGIGAAAEAFGAPAAWVGIDGAVGATPALEPLVTWRRDRG
jgi:thiamine biosynthesis lipoprotein